ncbi:MULTISPECIES: hypothetical protein [unclassified Sphingomonas]|uniref:hypothetical protein n=1 Tax=unclassified Sphingomonas TaxID=196159 RepID=UPI001F595572|nr:MULTISPECIES: hypothetical protein [unclassified Sphingomonas]
MDLSFPRFDKSRELGTCELAVLRGDLSVLLVGIVARQVSSPTAGIQALFLPDPDSRLFAPLDGAFNGQMARALIRWKDG